MQVRLLLLDPRFKASSGGGGAKGPGTPPPVGGGAEDGGDGREDAAAELFDIIQDVARAQSAEIQQVCRCGCAARRGAALRSAGVPFH